ncbi:MAG TPA: hypothetical protein VF304_06375 [Casimicrobiaceae bacterium]|nr:hypothetical protein [Casimicrobiaceae bacterium]
MQSRVVDHVDNDSADRDAVTVDIVVVVDHTAFVDLAERIDVVELLVVVAAVVRNGRLVVELGHATRVVRHEHLVFEHDTEQLVVVEHAELGCDVDHAEREQQG